MSFEVRVAILIGIGLAAAAFLHFGLDPIPQDPAYHAFADQRAFLGIPHFLNVLSNLPFVIAGFLGFWQLKASLNDPQKFVAPRWEAFAFATMFAGLFLTGIGSGYYHLDPNTATLFWDRLPMTLTFMGFFSLMIAERIHLKAGLFLLPVLLIAGVASVVHWDITEAAGRGDLKPYVLVQFLPILMLPFMLGMFTSPYTGTACLWQILGCYAGAKVLEHFDGEIYRMLGETVSGHTLKHLLAAGAGAILVRYLSRRRRIHLPAQPEKKL